MTVELFLGEDGTGAQRLLTLVSKVWSQREASQRLSSPLPEMKQNRTSGVVGIKSQKRSV